MPFFKLYYFSWGFSYGDRNTVSHISPKSPKSV